MPLLDLLTPFEHYALAPKENPEIAQFDIKTAFLNVTMKHKVYEHQVTGFCDPSKPQHVMMIVKSLYGTCQAHCEFNNDLNPKLKGMGFTVCAVKNSLCTLCEGSSYIHHC